MKNQKKAFLIILFVALILLTGIRPILADSTNTQVTVSNLPPTFTVNPAENPASDSTTPTNVGSNVTFQATATDGNSDSYYLIICKTNSVTANGSGTQPTCGGGQWCVSSPTASGVQSTCSYSASSGDTEVNAWYGFACDNVASISICTSSSQGTGSSGSPFEVNHNPTFTSVNAGSANPGGTINFTSVASDSDTSGTADTVLLVVCTTSGATASGCSVPANQLCITSLTSSNPSCSYNLPAVVPAGNIPYYAYIFDNHGLGSTNNPISSNTYTINNVAPIVSSVVINGGTDINLTENTTTSVNVTASVTDNNSCQDISSMIASAYRSSIGYSSCNVIGQTNNNNCYPIVSCSVVGGSCTGNSDATANYSCTVSMQYHADPTDTSTQFPIDNWLASVKATDNGLNTNTVETSTGVEVLSLVALNVSANINYGTLAPGSDSGSTNQTAVITATGNVGLDSQFSGTNLTYSSNTIPVGNQQYSSSTFTYGVGTALSSSPTLVSLAIPKTTVSNSPQTKNTYWGISIPSNVIPGIYTGTNTITAVRSSVAQW